MKNSYSIKRLYQIEHDILKKFLYEAIFQPNPQNLIPPSVVEQPELRKYIDKFGQQKGDYAIGVLDEERIVGLVWVRFVKGYGHIDSKTPELNISILDSYRGQKLGSLLIKNMLQLLSKEGYEKVSLSVQKANRALSLYKELGFEVFSEDDETYTMFYSL